MISLGAWYWSEGSISVETVRRPKVELFYWTAIMFSQTLGTALGDWMADTNGMGYEGGAAVFSAGLVLLDKPIEHAGWNISRFTASALLAVFMIILILVIPQKAGRHPGEAH